MKKILMTAAALALLAAPALAQYGGGGQNAGAGSQMRQSAGGERIATTGSTTKNQKAKGRKRMNTISGNCWDAANPACQNYRGRPHLR